jgi:enterochelin esterase family protein
VQPAPARPTPPTRDPHTAGYVTAKELPDGTVPPAATDGNFIIGPTHPRASDMDQQPGVPQGTLYEFTMSSADSKIYPGIAREPGTFGTPDPNDPAKMVVTTSHPAPYTRHVGVYVPKQYVPGTVAPFIVGADGIDRALPVVLDNLIAQHKVPVMIAISIGNGGGDAQGSERGLEYDTMSGKYAEFVETEVLPLVEQKYNVKLTRDPNGRATMGGSSGGSCALIMAVCADYGMVPPGVVSPRADLLRHVCESAVAAESADATWRVGVSRAPDSGEPGQAIADLDGGG